MEEDSETFTIQELAAAAGVSPINLDLSALSQGVSDNEEDTVNSPEENQDLPDLAMDTDDFNSNLDISDIDLDSVNCPTFAGDLQENRKRMKKPEKKKWKIEIQKKKRMEGEEYLGYQNSSPSLSKFKKTLSRPRPARVMKSTCMSTQCLSSKSRNCNKFSEITRQQTFDTFWKNMDWGQKRTYVLSLVEKIPKVRTRAPSSTSRRTDTFRYFLKLDGQRHQVCRTMFLNTLGIGRRQIKDWVAESKINRTTRAPITYSRNNEQNDFAAGFLDSLPKLPSHYCRQSTTKLYLEPIFTSKKQLYEAYRDSCGTNTAPVSTFKFYSLLDQKNISLYQPKKDRCDVCCGNEVGNITDKVWKRHVELKDNARAEKTSDKAKAVNGEYHVITMDVQSVKLSPMLNASALYYKTKLVVHNFTIYDLGNHNARCYWWHEGKGELLASVFATCLLDFIEEKFADNLPIIIYSDGCTNQNRNAMMSTALLDYSMRKKKVIFQKFLEKGHTQMEVDSVHSAIECKLKNKVIFHPEDYVKHSAVARTNSQGPYETKYLHHDFFKNYSLSKNQIYNSIRPGEKAGDSCVTDIRLLRYDPEGTISYKLKYGSDWSALPRKPKKVKDQAFPALYKSKIPIPKRKYDDLVELLKVIPAEYHEFYKGLPHKKQ